MNVVVTEPPALLSPENIRPKHGRLLGGLVVFILVVFCFAFLYALNLNQPPLSISYPITVDIEEGTPVRSITALMAERGVVRSEMLLYFSIVLFHDPTDVKASRYVFTEPDTTLSIAKRLTEGDFTSNLVRFTHFEGERARSIAQRAEAELIDFDTKRFLDLAEPVEGTLFPNTYFIPAEYTADELFALLTETFEKELTPLTPAIEQSTLSREEIIILASIIEREANSTESMRLVSGILQNRLVIGMPLQADASIEYVLEKPLSELTPEDLKIDSPYNTYTNYGLPPTPIGNPGITAIEAVLFPATSSYFYYITDDNGEFHYAETYTQHLINIERHLR